MSGKKKPQRVYQIVDDYDDDEFEYDEDGYAFIEDDPADRRRNGNRRGQPSGDYRGGQQGYQGGYQGDYQSEPVRPKRKVKKKKKGGGGGSRALLVIESILLVGALAYCAFVVMKFNQIQVQSEVVQAENTKLSEQLESYAPVSSEEEFSTYILTVWAADAEVVPNGDTMSLVVRASVYNDSLLDLTNENVPDLVCGGFHFKGYVEGAESIPMFHGQGNLIWTVEGIPADTQDFVLAYDETHLIYYIERVSDAILMRKSEAYGLM